MSIKSRIKELLHRHKFTTLLIYPPRPWSDSYAFLIRCDCGYTKLTNLPYGIKECFIVKKIKEKGGLK